MKNVGLIKCVEPNASKTKDGVHIKNVTEPPSNACCSFVGGTHYEPVCYIKKTWFKKLNRDLKWLKRWQRMCRYAGFPWKYIGQNKEHYIVRIYNNEFPYQETQYKLAAFTTVRYMYSPLYADIPQHAMDIYDKYRVSYLMAIVIAHHLASKRYDAYFGLTPNEMAYTFPIMTRTDVQQYWGENANSAWNSINNLFRRGKLTRRKLPAGVLGMARLGNIEPLMKEYGYARRK